MTGPGMRVILASPGAGVRFRLHDGREISVATDRRDELIELADLVTEMELVKHPFRSGIKAQIGVEY